MAAWLIKGEQSHGGDDEPVITGTRSYAEQDRLYRQGRFGNPGRIVTNAEESNHDFGLAWDIGVFTATGGDVPDGPEYDRAAAIGLVPGLEWGGNRRRLVDKPHCQLATGIEPADPHTRFEADGAGPVYA